MGRATRASGVPLIRGAARDDRSRATWETPSSSSGPHHTPAHVMNLPPTGHDPVMMNEVLEHLAPRPGQTVVDCTLGRAGHADAVADRLAPDGTLIGLDADPRNLTFAQQRLSDAPCNVRLFHANFAELDEVLRASNVTEVDGILADLGLSTNQLFDAQYGLSFT